MDASDAVGLISGLIAIFTFLTGATSARELLRPAAAGHTPASPQRRWRSRLVLGLSAPLFIVSMVVTLSQGMAGSDTGGAQFVLLLAGAVLLLLYATRLRTLSWPAFLVTCIVALGGFGLLMGSMSAGEEAEGVTAGLVIGTGVGLLGLAVRNRPTVVGTNRPPSGQNRRAGQEEREVLKLAREQRGDVAVGDVALHTSLSLEDARNTLEQLAARGFCERRALPGGAIIYRFPDFTPR